MLRDEPLGSEENGATSGKECVVNDNNAKYYAFYMYNTISDSMDNGYDYDPNNTSTEGGATGPGENSGNIKDNGWAWPSTAGSTGCGFGCYAGHTGMDIAVGTGSPFYAARDGVVRSAGPDQYMTSQAVCSAATSGIIGGVRMNGTQYTIVIDHQINGKTITTVYTHITPGTMLVKPGDTVKAGDLIAKTGGSGCSTAPHAHFGIYEAFPNSPIDPVTILGRSG
jgi:murein DD-endopeptidase MepM/ murein hydrolase activator NlpD